MMKIAVTYENGQVFQHFGHCEQFKLYDVQDGQVVSSQVVSAIGSGHGALAGFLQQHQVDTLICGGIGGGARTALVSLATQTARYLTCWRASWPSIPTPSAATTTARTTTVETTPAVKISTAAPETTKC